MYLLRLPRPVRWFLPEAIFDFGEPDTVYLTFDDGPVPEVTPFVLGELSRYQAKGTFFVVGENVAKYPELYQQVMDQGHQSGNHTYHHLKGTDTPLEAYLEDIDQTNQLIRSVYFRPPYGKITRAQARFLKESGYKMVMWSLLSGDFDTGITPEKCLKNVLDHIRPGDVVVFHDSIKAEKNLRYVLPHVLAFCQEKGWKMKALP